MGQIYAHPCNTRLFKILLIKCILILCTIVSSQAQSAPVISSFSPVSGPVGTEVTILGSGFTGTTLVYVGNGSTSDFVVISDNEIKVNVPALSSTGRLQVRSNAGTANSSGNFTVTDAPTISSFSPSSGPVGTEVAITGTGFNNANLVYVGSGSTSNFTIVSDSEIKVNVPSPSATGKVQVRSNNGFVISTSNFTVTGAPTISGFSPSSGPRGTEVIITGTGFTGANLVYVGTASTANFIILSDTEIKVSVPATSATGKIQVRSNDGIVYSSSNFTVTDVVNPTISSFTPESGSVGTEVTILGTNFTNATRVYVGTGSTTAFTIVSDTEIKVNVPTVTATGTVRVFTTEGQGATTTKFIVTGAPIISSFSPSSGPVGTEVTILGSNFTGANLVYVGSASTTNFTTVSDSEIRVNAPALSANGRVQVRTNEGTSSSSGIFTYTDAPTINSFSPESGPVGTQVTILGTNFTNATRVYVGTGSTTAFTIVSDTEIKVNVPTNTATGTVRVQTIDGQAFTTARFTVTGAPIINSFSPTSGVVGTEITIMGSNFTGATRVYVGSGSTTVFTLVSDSEIRVKVPSSSSTGSIRVYTSQGIATASGTFVVTGAPTVNSFSPTSGPVGTQVTVIGSNFINATRVYFGSGSTTTFTRVSDTEIRVNVPTSATSSGIRILASSGQVTSTERFTVTAPIITLTGTINDFNTEVGVPSTPQNYQLSGTQLSGPIVVSAPANFQVALTNDNAAFGPSVQLPIDLNGNVATTQVFLRYFPSTAGEHTGTITNSSSGAQSREIQVLGRATSPLPVEFVSVRAEATDVGVRVSWITASEKDNDYFDVEASNEMAQGFTNVARIASKVGSSSFATSYSYTDNIIFTGKRYYRIKQVDTDGTFNYSKVVTVGVKLNAEQLKVIPNPLVASSKVYITSHKQQTALLRMTSLTGKQIYIKQVVVNAGENKLPLPQYETLKSGIYIVTAELENKVYTFRVMKQ